MKNKVLAFDKRDTTYMIQEKINSYLKSGWLVKMIRAIDDGKCIVVLEC